MSIDDSAGEVSLQCGEMQFVRDDRVRLLLQRRLVCSPTSSIFIFQVEGTNDHDAACLPKCQLCSTSARTPPRTGRGDRQ